MSQEKKIRYEISRVPYLANTSDRWRCYDRLTHVVGYGENPTYAQVDCQIELEILTSDIHK